MTTEERIEKIEQRIETLEKLNNDKQIEQIKINYDLKEFLVSYKDLINILSSEQIEYVDVYHDKFHILTNDGCYFSFKLK